MLVVCGVLCVMIAVCSAVCAVCYAVCVACGLLFVVCCMECLVLRTIVVGCVLGLFAVCCLLVVDGWMCAVRYVFFVVWCLQYGVW